MQEDSCVGLTVKELLSKKKKSGVQFTWTATGTNNWNTFAAGRSGSSDLLLQNCGFLTGAESLICSESALEILQLSTLIV